MNDVPATLFPGRLRQARAATGEIAIKQLEHDQHLIELCLHIASLLLENSRLHARFFDFELRVE